MTDHRAAALEALAQQTIELPSWAFGNSGTRFKVFGQPGVARDPYEKLEDAAQVHRYTGVAPRVSLHIPWDLVDDYDKLAAHAADLGVRDRGDQLQPVPGRRLPAGLADPPRRRPSAARRSTTTPSASRSCTQTGSTDLKVWLPDGTNYPGQDDLRARQDRLADSLQQIYAMLGPDQRMLLEYKFFEPYFYAMDIPDWGTSLVHCLALGEQATSSSTPATTRPARTSSSSSCSCCGPAGWAPSTSTRATTPTTT